MVSGAWSQSQATSTVVKRKLSVPQEKSRKILTSGNAFFVARVMHQRQISILLRDINVKKQKQKRGQIILGIL